MAKQLRQPTWVSLREALRAFADASEGTQGSQHIMPLHWYVACRLVVEGGFPPDRILPRPPFCVESTGNARRLVHSPDAARAGERTVFGGLKTKDVDVVVSIDGIGPCVAVSLKGTLNAFRNLTNRMEEAAGDCTNLHIAYPALVYAFWHVLRANREGPLPRNAPAQLRPDSAGNYRHEDVALTANCTPVDSITRYKFAMEGLSGRTSIRQEPSLYEAVGIALVSVDPSTYGSVEPSYPPPGSRVVVAQMFAAIYQQYDQRFVYQAPALAPITRRLVWSPDSPALAGVQIEEYEPRVGDAEDSREIQPPD